MGIELRGENGRNILLYFSIIGLVFIIYYPSLYNYFVCDDLVIIKTCIPHDTKDILRALFALDVLNWKIYFLRPIIKCSFCIDYMLWGLNSTGYHLTNLFFHIGNTLLIYLLCNYFTGNRLIGLFSSFLFAFHGTNSGTVTWISGRTGVLCTFFCLLSLWMFILYSSKEKKTYYFVSIISFGLGLCSKETAAAFTGVFVIYVFLYFKKEWLKRLLYLSPHFMLLGGYLFWRIIALGQIVNSGWLFPPVFILLENMAYYIKHLCLPVDIGILFCAALLGIFRTSTIAQFTFLWINRPCSNLGDQRGKISLYSCCWVLYLNRSNTAGIFQKNK